MPRFSVQLTRPAARDLQNLPEPVRLSILRNISSLESDPLSSAPAKKKLRGFKFPLYRLRAGEYRILYRMDQNIVTVMRVIDRKDLERAIRGLRRR